MTYILFFLASAISSSLSFGYWPFPSQPTALGSCFLLLVWEGTKSWPKRPAGTHSSQGPLSVLGTYFTLCRAFLIGMDSAMGQSPLLVQSSVLWHFPVALLSATVPMHSTLLESWIRTKPIPTGVLGFFALKLFPVRVCWPLGLARLEFALDLFPGRR